MSELSYRQTFIIHYNNLMIHQIQQQTLSHYSFIIKNSHICIDFADDKSKYYINTIYLNQNVIYYEKDSFIYSFVHQLHSFG